MLEVQSLTHISQTQIQSLLLIKIHISYSLPNNYKRIMSIKRIISKSKLGASWYPVRQAKGLDHHKWRPKTNTTLLACSHQREHRLTLSNNWSIELPKLLNNL